MDGMPVNRSAGKAMNPPPPATEFTAPASVAAQNSRTTFEGITAYFNESEHNP
jgi:hypothetical protein